MNLWHLLILIISIAFGIESSKIRPNFDEIFGEEWDKNGNQENGNVSSDHLQNDQNITEIDQNKKMEINDQKKRETIRKFEAIKEKLKQKGKYQRKNSVKIEGKIAKFLGAIRHKIYKWKKELKLNKKKTMEKSFYKEKKSEFIERFKSLYGQRKQKEFVKELGINEVTFWRWKKELMPKYNKNEDKLQKMMQYFKIKKRNPKISDIKIAKELEIGISTLREWKKKFGSISMF